LFIELKLQLQHFSFTIKKKKQQTKSLDITNLSGKLSDVAATTGRQFGNRGAPQRCPCPVSSDSPQNSWSGISVLSRWRQQV